MSKQYQGNMEDVPKIIEMTLEEKKGRAYKQKRKELMVGRTRAAVVRQQLVSAYTILESIRFDYVGDTAFREKVVRSQQGIEAALSDFLLRDEYWNERIKSHNETSVEAYWQYTNTPPSEPMESSA